MRTIVENGDPHKDIEKRLHVILVWMTDSDVIMSGTGTLSSFVSRWSPSLGKMAFVIDSFTSTNVTLWGYGKITSIKIVFCSSILGVHNIDGINDTI